MVTASAAPAAAAQMRYDITFTDTGTLNGVAFTDQSVDISMIGDPGALTPQTPFPGFTVETIDPLVSATVSIGGGPAATFDFATRLGLTTVDNGGFETLFFSRTGVLGSDIADLVLAVDPATFDFSKPMAPLATPFPLFDTSTDTTPIQTSQGVLIFTDQAPATDGTFAIAGVPEPAAWALMLTGFFSAGAALRRRRRHTPVCQA
ncbi:PEPxxWA-CTERM sorting domain-containing protein [Phenylobacterium sp.]|uniref:PEPxxWA-CTERM sorting domain-containing protein n=1 Tax=Phenylobacterium sp. TaxID=1871053 RepID=UPI002F3F792B